MKYSFVKILAVYETPFPNTRRAEIEMQDESGVIETSTYVSAPDDRHGISQEVRDAIAKWISDGNPILPIVPTSLPPLSAKQFRLGLLKNNLLTMVPLVISNMSSPEKEQAEIEWEYATEFHRDHHLVLGISAQLGLTSEQVDNMWMEAMTL